jgi:hypothetical protein
MSCGICGGEVYTNGDGDLICQGACGETLTREEIEAADAQPACEQEEEWDEDYDDDWDHGQYDSYDDCW